MEKEKKEELSLQEFSKLDIKERRQYLVNLCKKHGCGEIGEYLFGGEGLPKEVCDELRIQCDKMLNELNKK